MDKNCPMSVLSNILFLMFNNILCNSIKHIIIYVNYRYPRANIQ